MTAWERLKNLWKLSEHAHITIAEEPQHIPNGDEQHAIFIPLNKRDPVKEITQPHE